MYHIFLCLYIQRIIWSSGEANEPACKRLFSISVFPRKPYYSSSIAQARKTTRLGHCSMRGGQCIVMRIWNRTVYIRRPDKQWSRLPLLLLLLYYWCHPFVFLRNILYIIYIATTRPSVVRFIGARSSYFVLTYILQFYVYLIYVCVCACLLYMRMMYIYFNDIKDDR
jgi:hypothetical protein